MFKKANHILVACFILVSTTGFTINLHYCHGKIYDLALFSPAHSCCESGSRGHCHATGDLAGMNHCKDESIILESIEDYVGPCETISLESTHTIELFLTASILFNVQGSDDEFVREAPWHKEPPPTQEVVLSQIQSYLI